MLTNEMEPSLPMHHDEEHLEDPELPRADPNEEQDSNSDPVDGDADPSSSASSSEPETEAEVADIDSDDDSDDDARELIKSLISEVGSEIFSSVNAIDSSICAPCVNIISAFSFPEDSGLRPVRTKEKSSVASLLHHRSMKALLECSSTCKMCALILHLLNVNGSDVQVLAQKLSANEVLLVKMFERDREEFGKTIFKPERYNWRLRTWKVVLDSARAWFEMRRGKEGTMWFHTSKGMADVVLSPEREELLLRWARVLELDSEGLDVDALSPSSSSESSDDSSSDSAEDEVGSSKEDSVPKAGKVKIEASTDILGDEDRTPRPSYHAAITDTEVSKYMLELLAAARSLKERYNLHSLGYKLREVKGYKGQIVELQVSYGTDRYPARVFTTIDDHLSEKHLGRPVYRNAKSSETLALMSEWFQNCFHNHPECEWSPAATDSDPFLPSRVIDVGDIFSPDFVPQLLITDSQRGKWATLSHRWGHGDFLKLLDANISELGAGIDVSKLPATFRDAIFITRHLGLRYLWIDSLCIIQDSSEDWLKEAASMPNIYRNSAITISAAASEDSTGGIFVDRSWLPTSKPCTLPIQIISPSLHGTLHFDVPFDANLEAKETNHLRTRAWCMQESLLSHRLLTFDTLQMTYTCVRERLLESRERPPSISREERNKFLERCQHRSSSTNPSPSPNSNPTLQPLKPSILRNMLISWYDILYDYTRRDLTFSNDRLVAISGIANIIGSCLQDQYFAGLWRRDMPRALLWSPFEEETLPNALHKSRLPPIYRAPSWSWASVESPISCFLCRDRMPDPPITTVLDIGTTLLGSDVYGQVKEGFLRIRGPLKRALVGETSKVWPEQPLLRLQGWVDDEVDITHVVFDVTQENSREGLECWCLLVTDVYGLVLVEVVDGDGDEGERKGRGKDYEGETIFKRIGIFHLRTLEVAKPIWFAEEDVRTIVIV
ncbi:hypothetical protein VTL71DRAFT_11333 [Oculimacula yallundae]|uniref:Heterokaryon incompatibility domain-containing protein n=1 Tax=Oculimacula yallundae TaxID=86028 RepID=A0ABR4CPU7_9HELO